MWHQAVLSFTSVSEQRTTSIFRVERWANQTTSKNRVESRPHIEQFTYPLRAGCSTWLCLLLTGCLPGLPFDPEERVSTFLRNVDKLLPDYTDHIPDDSILHSHSRANLKSNRVQAVLQYHFSPKSLSRFVLITSRICRGLLCKIHDYSSCS
jgi:hypothetical protein